MSAYRPRPRPRRLKTLFRVVSNHQSSGMARVEHVQYKYLSTRNIRFEATGNNLLMVTSDAEYVESGVIAIQTQTPIVQIDEQVMAEIPLLTNSAASVRFLRFMELLDTIASDNVKHHFGSSTEYVPILRRFTGGAYMRVFMPPGRMAILLRNGVNGNFRRVTATSAKDIVELINQPLPAIILFTFTLTIKYSTSTGYAEPFATVNDLHITSATTSAASATAAHID